MAYRSRRITLVLNCSLLATALVASLEAQIDTFLELRVRPMSIQGGSKYQMPLDVDSPGTLRGQVKAVGGSGHDIRVQVYQGNRLMFDWGQRHLIDVNLALSEPGRYWVVFDNSFSIVSQKQIWHDLRVWPDSPKAVSQSDTPATPPEIETPRETLHEAIVRLLGQERSRPTETISTATPNQWRGLKLNASGHLDALRALGQPNDDKMKRLSIVNFGELIPPTLQKTSFRHLKFKNVEGFRSVELTFWDDRLVGIDLRPASPVPSANLSMLYGIEFVPFNGDRLVIDKSEALEGSQYWLPQYWLLGIYDGNVVVAAANADRGETTDQGAVNRIQLVSNLVVGPLDQPQGSDLLK